MVKTKYSVIFCSIVFLCLALAPLFSFAEFDQIKRMNIKARYYFYQCDYQKAMDIWSDVLEIDSDDREALQGLSKAQEKVKRTQGKESSARERSLNELIQKGKNYYTDREYKRALSSWGLVLSIDPTNKEALDLIEEARVKAQYQINVLDKLDKEKRLKTPHIDDLDKIANKMITLLEKADVKLKEEKRKGIEKEIEKETATEIINKIEAAAKTAAEKEVAAVEKEIKRKEEAKEKGFITPTFAKGEKLYNQGKFKEAISEWDKIVPYLPELSEVSIKINELKKTIASQETKRHKLTEDTKLAMADKKIITTKEEKIEVKKAKRPNLLLIIFIVFLALFLPVKFIKRTKAKPRFHKAKMFPKMTKVVKDFEPRDLKKFLKKNKEDKGTDKDLFK